MTGLRVIIAPWDYKVDVGLCRATPDFQNSTTRYQDQWWQTYHKCLDEAMVTRRGQVKPASIPLN